MSNICITGSREINYGTPELILSLVQSIGLSLLDIENVITRGDPGINTSVKDFVDYYNITISGMAFCDKTTSLPIGAEPCNIEMEPMVHNPTSKGPKPNVIKTLVYYPDYQEYGNLAGQVRDKNMMDNSDILLLIWDTEDKEDKQLRDLFLQEKKQVHEVTMFTYKFEQEMRN